MSSLECGRNSIDVKHHSVGTLGLHQIKQLAMLLEDAVTEVT